MLEPIEITYEEFSDFNSELVAKMGGRALTGKEKIFAEKINEIINHLNMNP